MTARELEEQSFGGGSAHGSGTSCTSFTVPTITSTTGPLTIRFYSDVSTNCSGFNLTVSCFTPPPCTTPTAQPTVLNLTPATTTNTGSFTAASPTPNNYLVVISTNATPPSPVNGATYTIGGTIGTGYTIIDTDSNTTFTATGLLGSTLYYVYIFSYNSICSGGPIYYTSSPLTNSITTLTPTYCTPTSQGPQYVYIDDIRFMGTLNDVDNLDTNYTTGYQNFTGLTNKAIQAQGEGINIYYNNYSYTGSAHVKAWVDWNRNGTFQASELVYDTGTVTTSSATFGFVIPATTAPGNYRIRIRNNIYYDSFWGETSPYDFSPCENFNYTTWDDYDGEAEDYLFTVVAACNANILTVTNGERCGTGTVSLAVTGTASATGYNWYSNETGGTSINSTPTGTTWTTPSIVTTTNYWVTATNGTCESLKRTKVIAEINGTPTVTFTPSAPVICGDTAILQLTAGGDTETVTLINENFESGGLGIFSNVNDTPNGAPYDAITTWQNETSPYIPIDTEVWSPAISSGIAGNRFVMSTSDVNPPGSVRQFLETTANLNATNITGLTLTFDMYFSIFGDEIRVQANNGSGWNTIQTFTTSIGIGTRFASQNINIPIAYATSTLKIRFQFWSAWGDGVAIDNVKLFGERPLSTSFNYDTSTVDAFTNIACTPAYAYTGTPTTTIYIKPTLSQLENATFTIPVSAVLSSGCSATGSVTVTNNTKTFLAGTAGTNWNNAANWRPSGIPTSNNCVIIYDNDVNITGTNYTASGRNLIIKPTGNLNIASTNTIQITDLIDINTGGIFEVENDASLVQINNINNITNGTFIYKRTADIRKMDYVYWSSPVYNFNVNTISTPITPGPIYIWNTRIANPNGGQGNWVIPTTAQRIMTEGKGYIVRAPNSFSTTTPTPFYGGFTGNPNNGNITIPIHRGNNTSNLDDNWNLVGNPYPSALRASQFIFDNSSKIQGGVNLWMHGVSPSTSFTDPFYDNFLANYDATNDYYSYNFTGTSCCPAASADLFIGSGQGFFVQMQEGTETTDDSNFVTFNNSMRNASFPNATFFRTTNPVTTVENTSFDVNNIERHRIWLDIVNANNKSNRTLFGYIGGATMENDNFYDFITQSSGVMTIYSLINDKKFSIQGRSLPFDIDDEVPIGIALPSSGNYTIAVAGVDGIFGDAQDFYLKDNLLNVIHEIKANPYHFSSTAGTFDNRFEIVYRNSTLGVGNITKSNEIKVITNENVSVLVKNLVMESIIVYNVLGQVIKSYENINSEQTTLHSLQKNNTTLLLKIKLQSGETVIKKIVY